MADLKKIASVVEDVLEMADVGLEGIQDDILEDGDFIRKLSDAFQGINPDTIRAKLVKEVALALANNGNFLNWLGSYVRDLAYLADSDVIQFAGDTFEDEDEEDDEEF